MNTPTPEAIAVKLGKYVVPITLAAVIAVATALGTLTVGVFNMGGSYTKAKTEMDSNTARITSLEGNYNALRDQMYLIPSRLAMLEKNSEVAFVRLQAIELAENDAKRFNDQLINMQNQMSGLGQNISGLAKSLAELAVDSSKMRESAARLDEKVLLLDDIMKTLVKDGRLWRTPSQPP